MTVQTSTDVAPGRGPFNFKCYVMQMGGGGLNFFWKKALLKGVPKFNVISITSEWVGVQFPGKKHYVTLEWPLA